MKIFGVSAAVAGAGVLVSVILFRALAGSSCNPAVIPLPERVETRAGSFNLRASSSIQADLAGSGAAQFLARRLRTATGWPLELRTGATGTTEAKSSIVMTTNGSRADLGPEGYQLTITSEQVRLSAPTAAGLFYGVQTLLQLFPPDVFAAKPAAARDWQVPCVEITDQPRFKWRGMLLDVSRHFFNKTEIEQLMDLLALHKLNVLQLHLTDDQGWRVPIPKYPRLIEVGAWRKGIGFQLDPKASLAYGPDGRYGGYYRPEDIQELVAYAQARHITLVPEIEMPGHASAALAAYPEFSCNGGPFNTDMDGGVFAGVFCPGREETFQFLEGVLEEVMRLFPGQYVHIGGDEVPTDNWRHCAKCQARMKAEGLKTEEELEGYFVRRIEKLIIRQGRTLIGWSEIRKGGLGQNAVVMDWIGGAVEAANAGHDVIMTPTKYCYLDYYQSTNRATEPRAIGGFVPLDRVYAFEPVPDSLPEALHAHILGAQANLWTEYIPSFQQVQYMAFPRLCALAEVGWSPRARRDFTDFNCRFQLHGARLDHLGVNYRKSGTP